MHLLVANAGFQIGSERLPKKGPITMLILKYPSDEKKYNSTEYSRSRSEKRDIGRGVVEDGDGGLRVVGPTD